MIRRLISDIVWRTRLMYVLMIPFVGLVWTAAAAEDDGFVSLALTLSIAFAYMLGPLVSVSMIGRREIRILPVTNRDLWVTSWIVSAVLIPLAISAVQSLAIVAVATFTGSSTVSAETMFLASLYCFAYAGALVPIMPAQGYCMHNMSARQPRWLWAALAIACFLVFTGGLFLPFFIADDLPVTFDQFSWSAATALVMCFVISAVSLAWTPQRGGIVTPVQPARKTESTSRSIRLQSSSDRFTGIARVAWPIAATITVLSAVTLGGFVIYWATFESGTPLRSFLQNNAVLLFDTGFLPDRDMGDIWVIMAVASITTSSPWLPFARLLKVLPLTTTQVNALLLATPFAQWALVWLALIATHLAVIGTLPGTARPDVFVFVGGVSALGHVLMIRYGQGGLAIVMVLGALMSLTRRVSTEMWSVQPEAVLFAAGLVAFVVAAAVNHRTLTRSTSASKAYRGQTLPFGINAPGARP